MRHPISRATVALALSLSGSASGFNYLKITNRHASTSQTAICGKPARPDSATVAVEDALALLDQAKALRAEASELRQQLTFEKEERIRKELEKVDSLIDALLFHGMNDAVQGTSGDDEAKQQSKQQLMHTEEQVASLLISKRLSYEMVNQMFDRICESSNRPQSTDNCSPLISLLLDASCKVDCLEKENNPNKRWNHRVERDLRKKLFALGYGIRIDEVESERNRPLSIDGEKDYN